MALSTQPYKGARDFYPEDKRLQKYMFAKWRQVAERFGYEEYDAPILEPLDIYLAKTGDEIVNEQTYAFEDRGGRKVVIRPEMTPTVSRMVAARRQELGYPLRWYSIPNLWRYERPQRGRLREHWQLNVDIFGVKDTSAELEMIILVDAIFRSFGAKSDMYEIRLNDRVLVDYLLADYLGLNEKSRQTVSKLIDRMPKMSRSVFISKVDESLTAKQREAGVTEKLLALLDAKKLQDLPAEAQKQPSAQELKTVLDQLKAAGIKTARFDGTLMRGFDYYTGVVFEVFDTNPENNRSLLGGGRYDGLVGLFGVAPVPTVGFGWGDVTLANFLETHRLLPALQPETDVYVALIGDVSHQATPIVADLRQGGLNVAVGAAGKKIGDQLKNADKKGIERVLIIGETELKNGMFTVKNLKTGQETKVAAAKLAKAIKEA
ncbi:histidine--tRNA ligase [Candidatus Saccharibacteria bacterium CG_4_10_14_0_2_um_filter_52_9]|nr:MAG: histidine--tRNA ligase [Candidatus Saccharibacteria bacterium CG_4_10_14_0_2_um_filter_52_9]